MGSLPSERRGSAAEPMHAPFYGRVVERAQRQAREDLGRDVWFQRKRAEAEEARAALRLAPSDAPAVLKALEAFDYLWRDALRMGVFWGAVAGWDARDDLDQQNVTARRLLAQVGEERDA